MRIPVPAQAVRSQWVRALGKLSVVGIVAGLAAGCSTSMFQLSEPVFTGSTPNQQQILASQAGSPGGAVPPYAAPPVPPYAVAQGSAVYRQALPAPAASAYSPAGTPQPIAALPQPYTSPKPYAAGGPPTPAGRVASAPAAFAPPPLPVRRGMPPTTLAEQARSIAQPQGGQLAPMQVASVDPRGVVRDTTFTPLSAQQTAMLAPPLPAMQQGAPANDAQPSDRAGATDFRWPVRGRIISGFGKKASGERNDGINLAVPEGTSVKAAEDGEVIYSGNELKSYGNLILIRHDNGWVSAYAHNSELKVRRGDKIRRGQIVALSGMSGGVTTPQVHFELRKDATPVDPLSYLSDA